MNLLVTGGCGFIGSHVLDLVVTKAEVKLVVNVDSLTYAGNLKNVLSAKKSPKYHLEVADIRDKAEMFRIIKKYSITHILHLAAESHVDRSIAGPGDFIQTNIVGTFNLLECCRELWGTQGNRRFLHVSTDEVYGSLGPYDKKFSEATTYAPNSPYSASKASGDLLVRAYHHTYSLDVVTTNCSNNYGPRQHPEKLIPLVIKKVRSKEPIPVYGTGANIRDWLHVSDHAEGLWKALISGKTGETYCFGGDCERESIYIVKLICDIIDAAAPELGSNSKQFISFVKDRAGHDYRYAIDFSKARRELGWSPKRSFESSLEDVVKWYLVNVN